MSDFTIHEVSNKNELIAFIKFPTKLYNGVSEYVPPILSFELSTLSKQKNPAFDHCEARYWVVKRKNEIVGRIAGILLNVEAEEKKHIRFGWVDFIDDYEVSKLLFDAVITWAKDKQLEKIHGPLGFTDLDFEGALVEGFDQIATQATIYNFPYYLDHYKQLGFTKACDWLEYRFNLPSQIDKRLQRTANLVAKRSGFEAKTFKKSKDILKYTNQVFDILNEAYGHLYGYYPLSQRQIDYFTKMYFGFVKKEFVSIIVDQNDEVAAFALSLPSLSTAFQKAKGWLYPFGFIPVLRAMNNNDIVDMFLIGTRPKFQKQGASALLFQQLNQAYVNQKVKRVFTGPMLEENLNVINLWSDYIKQEGSATLRRRCYIKAI